MGDSFSWVPTIVGTWDSASNWTDTTNPGTVGIPGPTNTAVINGPISGAAQTIDGPGSAATLDLSGLNLLVGTFSTGVLNVDGPTAASVSVSGVVSATQGMRVGITGSGTVIVGSGATLLVSDSSPSSELVLGLSAGSSGTIVVGAGGSLLMGGSIETSLYDVDIGDAGTGLLAVTGAGATFDTGGNPMELGNSASGLGIVEVTGGAHLTAASSNSTTISALAIGHVGGGSLVVSDPGSEVTANGYLYVGRASGGLLAVENSAVVIAGIGSGAAIGDGNGTLVTLTGGLGVLELNSGGTFDDGGTLTVGGNGASGLANVDAGLLEATSELFVGVGNTISGVYYTGTGTILISDAGTVELNGTAHPGFSGINLAAASGSEGLIQVTGSGALLNAGSNLLNIGNNGIGTVAVSGGGVVEAASPGSGFAAIVLGNSASGVGTLTVDGGSTVAASGPLTVGNFGRGTLAISNGATVTSVATNIGLNTGSSGNVSLAGNGSTLLVSTLLQISTSSTGAGGAGGLEIGSGSGVSAGTAAIGPQGSIELTAGTFATTGGLTIAAGGTLGGSGVVESAVADSGVISVSGALDVLDGASGSGRAYVAGGADLIFGSGVGAALETDFTGTGGRIDILSPASFAGIVGGIGTTQTIFAAGASSLSFAGGSSIELFGSSGAELGTIALDGSYAAGSFLISSDGTLSEAPCFLAGTMIDGVDGPVAVEALRPGMLVTAWRSGQAVPASVKWTGRRGIDLRRHPNPDQVRPVRIARAAFGPGLPVRPLFLSPDHAVFQDGVLIPVKHLINGRSIAYASARAIEYWHVELDRHDILHAEGLPVESYLDTGNRLAFENGRTVQLHPNFSARSWDDACAELVQDGDRLRAVKRRLFERARRAPGDAAVRLRVSAGKTPLLPVSIEGGAWRYRLPAGEDTLILRSPAWMPAMRHAASLDRRRLGVRLFAIMVDGQAMRLTDRALQAGFHALEETREGLCRWTNGRATLVLPLGARDLVLSLRAAEAVSEGRAA